MKKQIHLVATMLLFFPLFGYAQSISQYVISSAGEYQVGKYGKTLHYTLGEPVVDNLKNTNILSQGFHQLYQITVDIDYAKPVDYSLDVFPNPTSGVLHLNTDSELIFDVIFYDVNGQMIFQSESNKYETDFNISALAQGMYYLSVIHENAIVKTFKISKN